MRRWIVVVSLAVNAAAARGDSALPPVGAGPCRVISDEARFDASCLPALSSDGRTVALPRHAPVDADAEDPDLLEARLYLARVAAAIDDPDAVVEQLDQLARSRDPAAPALLEKLRADPAIAKIAARRSSP